MTSVLVTLANGSVRTFNTAWTSKAAVETEALHSGALQGTSLQQRAELATTLADIFDGRTNDVLLSSDTLTAAGIATVKVGNPAPEVEESTPVFDSLAAENDDHDFEDSNPVRSQFASSVQDFKQSAVVSRTVAIAGAAASFVVGVVAGALIW